MGFPPVSSAAPVGASYATIAANATLTAERVLTAGAGIALTDGGPNSTLGISATAVGSPFAIVRTTGDQSIPNNTDTKVVFNTLVEDSPVGPTWWPGGVGPLTPPSGNRALLIIFMPQWDISAVGFRDHYAKWGALVNSVGEGRVPGYAGYLMLNQAGYFLMTSGGPNELEIHVTQTSGAPLLLLDRTGLLALDIGAA